MKFRFDYRRDRAFIGGIGLDVTDRLRAESSLPKVRHAFAASSSSLPRA